MEKKGLGTSRIMAAMVCFIMASMTLAYAGDTASDTIGATLNMSNSAPTVDSVSVQNGGVYDPTSGTTTAIAVQMTVTDANGWSDINTVASGCTVKKGAVTENLGSCAEISNSSVTTAIFECTGSMQYYYQSASDWAVNCTAVDAGALSGFNDTATLTYSRLESINVVNTNVTWTGITTSSTNVSASNNPVVTDNLGNANFASQNVTAAHLAGVTTPAELIAATDFEAHNTSAAGGQTLADGTPVTVSGMSLVYGSGANNNMWLFLKQISTPVSAQSYASTAPWQVTVYGASN